MKTVNTDTLRGYLREKALEKRGVSDEAKWMARGGAAGAVYGAGKALLMNRRYRRQSRWTRRLGDLLKNPKTLKAVGHRRMLGGGAAAGAALAWLGVKGKKMLTGEAR